MRKKTDADKIKSWPLRFGIWYLLFSALIVTLTGYFFYDTSWKRVYNTASDNMLSQIEKNASIIDDKLMMINEYMNGLSVDEDIIDSLNQYAQAKTEYDVFALDRQFKSILDKYFLYSDSILTTSIMTKRFNYGYSGEINVVPISTFEESSVYRAALQGNGRNVWIPTYHFFDEFQQKYIHLKSNAYQYVFSVVKLLRASDNDYAILMVNFLSSFFNDSLGMKHGQDQALYFVMTQDGQVIAHDNEEMITTQLNADWLQRIEGSGSVINITVDGQEGLLAYVVSDVTGWVLCTFETKSSLMEGVFENIAQTMIYMIILLLAILILAMVLMYKGLLKPLVNLHHGFHLSGRGDFNTPVEETGMSIMKSLIHHFNHMNRRLKQLIYENYQMVILKREQELNVYNLQVNPHFILNALNLINLELIQNEQYELSDYTAELAGIMDYTLRNTDVLVPFEDDWKQTLAYVGIMKKRYPERFDFEYEIDDKLFSKKVPKFLLQPLIENILQHGCYGSDKRVKIRIDGALDGRLIEFCVTDNGRGFSEERLKEIMGTTPSAKGNHAGGINNARFRIKYIYGEEYDIQITSVPMQKTQIIIRIPETNMFEKPLPD